MKLPAIIRSIMKSSTPNRGAEQVGYLLGLTVVVAAILTDLTWLMPAGLLVILIGASIVLRMRQ